MSSSGHSFTGELLALLLADALLLPNTSLHVGATLTRDSSVGKWPFLRTPGGWGAWRVRCFLGILAAVQGRGPSKVR